MALFKRPDLKAKGLSEEQIDYIMTESNRSLAANYTPTSDVQAQIDAAVKAAAPEPANVLESPEYQAIVAERDMLRAIGGDDFVAIKPKFRETVFGMLDRGEKAAPVADQLKTIGEKYEEYFVPIQQEQSKKPSFGADTKGSAPTGNDGPSFMDTWGFVPKKQ